MRKLVSLFLLFNGIILLLTSVVLYIEPPGRIAYWIEWRFLGLTKEMWDDLHINSGVFFLISSFIHLYYNFPAIKNYLKQRAKSITANNVIISLLLTVVLVIGSILKLPPFSMIAAFSDDIKNAYAKRYGNPPYGHAELSSLEEICKFVGLKTDEGVEILTRNNIKVTDTKMSLRDLARANGVSPSHIYDILIRERAKTNPFLAMPPQPPEGTGKLTLSDLIKAYNLPSDEVFFKLKNKNISASPDKTLKEIAKENGMEPRDVYKVIRGE